MERDGVLNSLAMDPVRGVLDSPLSGEHLVVHRHASSFVRSLNERGYLVIVVTEQPAIARGELTSMALSRIHHRLQAVLGAAGARIDGVFHCPHDPGIPTARGPRGDLAARCRCKRPAPGLILSAAHVHNVDLHRSFMICRNLKDVRAGRFAALETILLTDVRMRDIEASPDLRPHHAGRSLPEILRIIDSAREALLQQ
jgi:D-glycero-D-manno-heptose 1,7-bisphosphate phosphatase